MLPYRSLCSSLNIYLIQHGSCNHCSVLIAFPGSEDSWYFTSIFMITFSVGYFVRVCTCVHACYDLFLYVCVSTAGFDIGSLSDGSPVALHSQAGRRTPRTLAEEPLDGILSPELDKMVTDGQWRTTVIQTLSVVCHCGLENALQDKYWSVFSNSLVSESILSKLYKIPGL